MASKIRVFVAAVGLALVATACFPQWGSARYDSGASGYNRREDVLAASNIATLGIDWIASLAPGEHASGSPVAQNNVVYLPTTLAAGGGRVLAFAANGAGCSGVPKSCTPLWSYPASAQPLVLNYKLYAGASAYDATGSQNCTGNPKVCTPIWTTSTPVVAKATDGTSLYAIEPATDHVLAFPLDGHSCTGAPSTCTPTATWNLNPHCVDVVPDFVCTVSDVVVAGTDVFVGAQMSAGNPVQSGARIVAFETTAPGAAGRAVGGSACCLYGNSNPLRGHIAVVGNQVSYPMYSLDHLSPPTVALSTTTRNGPEYRPITVDGISRDAYAITDDTVYGTLYKRVIATASYPCGPTPDPLTCTMTSAPILRSYTDGLDSANAPRAMTDPAVAKGLLYQGWGHGVHAFDATGASGCSGTPIICRPLRSVEVGADVSQLIVSNGRVFVTTTDGHLLSLALDRA